MKINREFNENKNEYLLSQDNYFLLPNEIKSSGNEFCQKTYANDKNRNEILSHKRIKIRMEFILCLFIIATVSRSFRLDETKVIEEKDIIEDIAPIVTVDYENDEEEDASNLPDEQYLQSDSKNLWGGKLKIITEPPEGLLLNDKLTWLYSLEKNDISDYFSVEEVKINDNNYFIVVYFSMYDEYGEKGSGEYQVILNKEGEFLYQLKGEEFLYPPIGDTGLNMDSRKVYDLEGNLMLEIEDYFPVGVFVDGLCPVLNEEYNKGYINIQGELVIPCIYQRADSFHDGVAFVQDSTGSMYIDTNGNRILDDRYEFSGMFGKGLCRIREKESRLYGYINTFGSIVIPCIYDFATDFDFYDKDFNEGIANVKLDGKETIINTKGEEILDDNLRLCDSQFKFGLVEVEDMNTYLHGFVDRKGNLKIPCIYEQASVFENGVSKVMVSDEEFYINTKNERVNDPEISIESNNDIEQNYYGYIFDYISTEALYVIKNKSVYNLEDELLLDGYKEGSINLLNSTEFYYDDGQYIHIYRYIEK